MVVSLLSASLIRGCHPTYTHDPFNEDWCLVSIIDYYRMKGHHPYPHPCKYWRYVFDLKWGWKYSIIDFKTQSIKEYLFISKQIQHIKHETSFRMYVLFTVFMHHTHNPGCLPQSILEYLYNPSLKEEIQKYLQSHLPIRLPATHPVNPLQVFLGRCYQYGFIHKNTKGCYIRNKWIALDTLRDYCKIVPRPCIHFGGIMINNKNDFMKLLCKIILEDNKNYTWPDLSLLQKEHLVIDTWISDLFGW